jgi:hypothetical protein
MKDFSVQVSMCGVTFVASLVTRPATVNVLRVKGQVRTGHTGRNWIQLPQTFVCEAGAYLLEMRRVSR